MKVLLFLFAISFSTDIFSQDSLKINVIDSIVNYNEQQTSRVSYDKFYPRKDVYVSHGELDTGLVVFKFSSMGSLIEYSRFWIGSKDTSQITSFYFDKDELIKTVLRTPYNSYCQVAYYENKKTFYSADNEGGVNPNANGYLNKCKKILQAAKRKLQNKFSY